MWSGDFLPCEKKEIVKKREVWVEVRVCARKGYIYGEKDVVVAERRRTNGEVHKWEVIGVAVSTIRDALDGDNPLCQRESFEARKKLIRELNNGRAAIIHVNASSIGEDDPLGHLSDEHGIHAGVLHECEGVLGALDRVFSEMGEPAPRAHAVEALDELRAFNEDPASIGEREKKLETARGIASVTHQILALAVQGVAVEDILERVEGSSENLIQTLVSSIA